MCFLRVASLLPFIFGYIDVSEWAMRVVVITQGSAVRKWTNETTVRVATHITQPRETASTWKKVSKRNTYVYYYILSRLLTLIQFTRLYRSLEHTHRHNIWYSLYHRYHATKNVYKYNTEKEFSIWLHMECSTKFLEDTIKHNMCMNTHMIQYEYTMPYSIIW